MTRLFGVLGCLLIAARGSAAQSAGTQSVIDSNWLTVDSASKTATFQLIAGLTQLNSGLNFNGFNEGKLTLTVPAGWNVVIRFKNQDPNL
ncbi:MAG TPA: sulfocyanin-like copper-binding protein, partial [Gemmatimonadales bacterium]